MGTKMKGCTGTYLWGPDEIHVMQNMGNRRADAVYGAKKLEKDACKADKQRFVMDKYQKGRFAGAPSSESESKSSPAQLDRGDATATIAAVLPESQLADAAASMPKIIRRAPVAAAAWQQPVRQEGRLVARKVDISDDFFDSIFGEDSKETSPKQQTAAAPKAPEKQKQPFLGFDFDDLLGDVAPLAASTA